MYCTLARAVGVIFYLVVKDGSFAESGLEASHWGLLWRSHIDRCTVWSLKTRLNPETRCSTLARAAKLSFYLIVCWLLICWIRTGGLGRGLQWKLRPRTLMTISFAWFRVLRRVEKAMGHLMVNRWLTWVDLDLKPLAKNFLSIYQILKLLS